MTNKGHTKIPIHPCQCHWDTSPCLLSEGGDNLQKTKDDTKKEEAGERILEHHMQYRVLFMPLTCALNLQMSIDELTGPTLKTVRVLLSLLLV